MHDKSYPDDSDTKAYGMGRSSSKYSTLCLEALIEPIIGPQPRKVRPSRKLVSYQTLMCTSISDHMYRMAMFAMCTSDTTLDISK